MEKQVAEPQVETTKTLLKASDNMQNSLSFIASLLAEMVTSVASSCINFVQRVFHWGAWQGEKTTPSTNNQTIDSNSAAFHQESIDTMCSASPETSIPPIDTMDDSYMSRAFEKDKGVVTKQPVLGGPPRRLKFEDEEIEANPGCCVNCCGLWLECSDGLVP